MAISPGSSGSDAEKGVFHSAEKTARFHGEKSAPAYAEKPLDEEGSVVDFEETRVLKYVLLLKKQLSMEAYFISGRASASDTSR